MKSFRLLAIVCCVAACDDAGQSGSEVMKPPYQPPRDPFPPGLPPQPHCPCDGLRQMQPIRATIVGAETFPAVGTVRYELVAKELLGPDPLERNELGVGDHFGGYWNGQLACGGAIELAVGSEVLAFHRRGRQDGLECCEYIACSDRCRAANPDGDQGETSPFARCTGECETSTQQACAEHRQDALLHGELMLTPWADALLVGQSEGRSASIRVEQLGALQLDRDACMRALPDLWPSLRPPEASAAPMADHAEPQTVDAPPSPPVPQQPPTSGAEPLPPSNPSSVAADAPPAGPEEIRVRCAGI